MSKIIHRDELTTIRADATHECFDPECRDAPMATVIRLLDHIDAMREHTCFYRFSEVKAEKAGGPAPACTRCGEESPTRRAQREAKALQGLMAEAMRYAERTVADLAHEPTIADGTRGMERGR